MYRFPWIRFVNRLLQVSLVRVVFVPVVVLASSAMSRGAEPVDFNRDVRPLLSNKCFKCHGPDPAERKGGTNGLRLDTADGIRADLGGHAAVAPGKPEQSELIRRITTPDADEVMPPPQAGERLNPREVQILTEWVRQGAPVSTHWSYTRPVRPAVPGVKHGVWPRNDIDRFLLARLEREGLAPTPEADRYTLLRRLSLDLTGLPPTAAEVDEFVKDESSDAYEKLVDRLLKKDAYGEHWAREWLDLARYADSAGYADDPSRTIWAYRDYVVRSFNANKPFDQFTIEQIAGDLLPNPTEDQLIATAFHRNTLTNNEGGTNDEEFRNVAIVDRVNTTMAVWMGTTIACAQCHNHKYDPLLQSEFFQLFAFFNNSEDADRRDESPLLSFYTDEQKQQRTKWEAELATVEKSLLSPAADVAAGQAKWEAAFPSDLAWRTVKPASVKSSASGAITIGEDAAVLVPAGAKQDTYTVELPLGPGKYSALRLEALPHASLPGQGPGHAAGNFIISRVAATLVPAAGQSLSGRYVRIESPGKQKMLSLAEVQLFQADKNLATAGEAKQSSTDYAGDAKRAIDGNTDGRYTEANSVTHTALSDDPWWEVDLKATQSIDRIVLWNRTDAGTEDRLKDCRVVLLNDQRQPVFQAVVGETPKPKVELSLTGQRSIEFTTAVADYAQETFAADQVLKNPNPKQKGWAIGGSTGKPHSLTLVAASPFDAAEGSKLVVTIEQQSQPANHVLGHFRLAVTADARAAEFGRTPPEVIAALQVPAAGRSPEQLDVIRKHYLSFAPELEPTRKQLATLRKQIADLAAITVPIMKDLPPNQRRVTRIQFRGNYLTLGDEVREGTPGAFPPLPTDAPPNRLTLARWLVDEQNPLTARVVANRYWEQLFGVGIVATSEEFGAQGDQPVHPELLDYLATELTRLKWDLKAFVKQLVMTAAYRQSSRVTEDLAQRDPENRLLARGPRFRLSAETVRDQALAVSGLLSTKMYGPPVRPPQPSVGLSAAFGSGIDWQTSQGEDRYRRGLYTTWRRSNPYPSMATFDAPNREVCTLRRVRTNTPLQALVTLNDPVYIESAQSLARKIMTEGGSTTPDRATYGFRRVLTRPPQAKELARLVALYDAALADFQQHADQAAKLATDPLGPAPAGVDVKELAAWTLVANVLLNLDETIMKR